MSQAQFDHEFQELVGLEPDGAPQPDRTPQPDRAHRRKLSFQAWYTVATLVAILVAWIGISSPMGSQGAASLPSGAPLLEGGHDSTPSYGSSSVQNNVPHQWPHDRQALESERDIDDVDSDATEALPLSLEIVPPPDLPLPAHSAGTLIAAAHLRIATGFARGPPSRVKSALLS